MTKRKSGTERNKIRKKQRLAIIIPTANRWRLLDIFLLTIAEKAFELGIDIVVYDSSSNRMSESIVYNFIFDKKANVKYKRWEKTFDGFSIDNKLIDCVREFSESYDYLWIIRDDLVINPQKLRHILSHLQNFSRDAVVLGETENEIVFYDDAAALFAHHGMEMMMLGTVIVKSSFAREVVKHIPLDEKNYSLYLPMAYFQYWNQNVCKASVFRVNGVFSNEGRNILFWRGDAFKKWVYYYGKCVMSLPSRYDDGKDSVLRLTMFGIQPFSLANVLSYRGYGTMCRQEVLACKNVAPQVTSLSWNAILQISIMPRFFARCWCKHYHMFLKFFRMIWTMFCVLSGTVPKDEDFS